jgi:hypothetical protein
MQGCIKCPEGRTTDADPTKQKSITDCYVIPGNGIFVGGTPTPPGPWNPDVATETNQTKLALLPVLPCPTGYYGLGGELASKCQTCTAGLTTAGPGSSSAAACDSEYHLPKCFYSVDAVWLLGCCLSMYVLYVSHKLW